LRADFAALARGRVLVGEDAVSVDAPLGVGAVADDTVFVAGWVRGQVEGGRLGDCGGVEGAGARGGEAATGEDGGHDGEVVLEFVEVLVGRGGRFVERVEEALVVGAEGEFGDDVGEVEV
jgi:hypothetical protein